MKQKEETWAGGKVSEVWKDIPGFSRYEVSSYGVVRNKKTKYVHKEQIIRGYHHVVLTDDLHKRRGIGVHRVVCLAFHGLPPAEKCEAAHWDDDKSNNNVENIRWASPKENAKDRDRNNKTQRGDKHARAALTSEDVLKIRERRAAGETYSDISKDYPVNGSAIRKADKGYTWNHV